MSYNLSLGKKIVIFLLLIFNNLVTGYAKEEQTNQSVENQAWLDAIKITSTENWKEFKNKKELIDINYDLYRMRTLGPNLKDQVILAQDPKGYFLYKHDNAFCSPEINDKCVIQSPLYTYGDIKTSLLLDNIYSQKEKIDLATEVIRNIINPFPSNIALEMLEATAQERKKPKNQAKLAEAYASQARLGVARNSFHNIFFNRLPLDSFNQQPAAADKEKFSVISIMEQQAKNRFENPQWHELIENSNNEVRNKEMAKMESFKIWMDYHKYKQNERIESLLATIVAQQENIYQILMQKNAKNN